jgi:histidinol-phosphatase
MLVAQGAVDIAVDAIGLEPYDIAALIPIVQAAGGTLTNRHGVVDWRSDTAITSSYLLHAEIMRLLTRSS